MLKDILTLPEDWLNHLHKTISRNNKVIVRPNAFLSDSS